MIIGRRRERIKKYAEKNHVPILRDATAEVLIKTIDEHKPESILEIGTAIGYSAGVMLNAGSEASMVDTIEVDADVQKIAKKNLKKAGYKKRVNFLLGDAKDVLKSLDKTYDFIFLDGPKGQYIKYLPTIKALLNKGGVLFADNVLYRDMVFTDRMIPRKKRTIVRNLEAFLTDLKEDENFKTDIIGVEDGVSISIKGK